MKRLQLVFFVWIFLAGCNQDRIPDNIIRQDEMTALLKDIHLVKAYTSSMPQNDSVKQVASNYYASVYQKHKTDSLTFTKSLKFYSEHPQMLDKMYGRILKDLETRHENQPKPKIE